MSAAPYPSPTGNPIPIRETSHPWFPFNAQKCRYDLEFLTIEELGLMIFLRSCLWNHGPLPTDEKFLLKRVAPLAKLSRYKFSKLFEKIRGYFQEEDGLFWFQDDENERRRDADISSKRKIAGLLSAELKRKRMASAESPRENQGRTNGNKRPTSVLQESQQNGNQPYTYSNNNRSTPEVLPVQEEFFITSPPACRPPDLEVERGRQAGGLENKPVPKARERPEPLPPEEVRQLNEQCESCNLHPPLAAEKGAELKARFLSAGVRDWIPKLVKFPGQNSAGLWMTKTVAELVAQYDTGPADNDAKRILDRLAAQGKL